MSVTFYIPGTEHEMNVSNSNFLHLMTCLGYDQAELCWIGELPVVDLSDRVKRLRKQLQGPQSIEFTRSTWVEKPEGVCSVIHYGVDLDYMNRRVRDLSFLVSQAYRVGESVHYL